MVDGRLLRVYIYPLDRRFNGEILNRLQMGGWATGSECDYGLTPCTEAAWNGLFSVFRQFATEVLVLLKFLAAPVGVLTADPLEADLLLVPYLAKSDCAEAGTAGREPCWGTCKCSTAMRYLFQELQAQYSWATRGRHLFLGTGDAPDLPLQVQLQPLLLSLGPSYCGGHIVVPSPNLDPALQPGGVAERKELSGRAPERHLLALWFGSLSNQWRSLAVAQLSEYALRPDARPVALHSITTDYEARDLWSTPQGHGPPLVLEQMLRSVFCPVLKGDWTHQKRLFDAVLTGCIPVVIAFPSHRPGKVSWWRAGGPPVENMVPFPEDVDYRRLVLEVPERELMEGRFVDAMLHLSESEVRARQEAMREFRQLLRFDFTGSGPDAFTMTVRAVHRFLRQNASEFNCGVPDVLPDTMYGGIACCPVAAPAA